MDPSLRSILVCPLCHSALDWSEERTEHDELLQATATCPSCGIRSSVLEGIGFFLPGDAPTRFPDRDPSSAPEPPLLPPASAAPLESRVLAALPSETGRLLELEPERPFLTRHWAGRAGPRPLLGAGDPDRLRAARDELGPGGGWDGICFEVHSLPFADRSLAGAVAGPAWQTASGPLVVLRELRRVVRGPLVAPTTFVGAAEAANTEFLRARGWATTFQEARCLELFRRARWDARFELLEERPLGPAPGRAFPVAPTVVRAGLVVAT